MDKTNKNEHKVPDLNETLTELNKLIKQPGYLYSLLLITISDLFLPLEEYVDVNWWDKISYQEVSFLFGLLVKSPLDLTTIPDESESKSQTENTYRLLKQLHDYYGLTASGKLFGDTFEKQKSGEPIPPRPNIFTSTEAIIEAVFYDDSGAYDFQYWDSAIQRYSNDNEWITKNLGFKIEDAVELSQFAKTSSEIKRLDPPSKGDFRALCKWALRVFTLSTNDIPKDKCTVDSIVSRFSVTPGQTNKDFTFPSDYNEINVRPLIRTSDKNLLLPVSFDLARTIDESPFYLIQELDKRYAPIALKHRGDYTEEVTYQKLVRVFGKDNVYKGAKIRRPKGQGIKKKGYEYTDIDVLVLFGNKAIVIQAKSKKMTLLSRKGNIQKLATDFQEAVQEAYYQGLKSREHILAHDASFVDSNGKEIKLLESINDVYLLTITTDNYPALHMQVHSLLEKKDSDPWPLAMNVFDLDVLTTYLPDPFDFLYYINQRVHLADKIMAGNEIICLGYHLDQKLFIDSNSKYDHMMIAPDFGQLVDDDIMRQIYGTEEEKKKSRLRQKWKNDSFIQLVTQIKASKVPGLTDAVFFLYNLSSQTADKLVEMMGKQKQESLRDHSPHTMAMPLDSGMGGITFVVEYDRNRDLHEHLMVYSVARKYKTKADEWLGVGSYATSSNIIDSVMYSKEPWKYDQKLEKLASVVVKPGQVVAIGKKIGRNEPCYCGSGKKYKKCHYLKGE